MKDIFDKYNYAVLNSMIGEKVCVKDDQGNSAFLVVSEVTQNILNGDTWEAFSIVYSGDKSFRIPQGTYTFQHEKFGKKRLFLSPNSETEYETVITRERKSTREQHVSSSCFSV